MRGVLILDIESGVWHRPTFRYSSDVAQAEERRSEQEKAEEGAEVAAEFQARITLLEQAAALAAKLYEAPAFHPDKAAAYKELGEVLMQLELLKGSAC